MSARLAPSLWRSSVRRCSGGPLVIHDLRVAYTVWGFLDPAAPQNWWRSVVAASRACTSPCTHYPELLGGGRCGAGGHPAPRSGRGRRLTPPTGATCWPCELDPDGRPFIAIAAVPAAVAAVRRRPLLALLLGVLPAAMAAFFRDPDRRPDLGGPVDPDLVVAPADGRVLHVGEPQPGVAPGGAWQQVAIFLSVTDVHINRSPYGGRVTSVTYRPGRFHTAFSDASGLDNERSEITLEADAAGSTLGWWRSARSSASWPVGSSPRARPGDVVATGDRIGLMKFGSRMDVFVPPGVELLVAVGDKTVAGETPLARWTAAADAS